MGERIALWGGMNAAITLERGSADDIRGAVDEAIRVCAPGGGFVLYPVDPVWAGTPWSSVEIMIERWRQVGQYPLTL